MHLQLCMEPFFVICYFERHKATFHRFTQISLSIIGLSPSFYLYPMQLNEPPIKTTELQTLMLKSYFCFNKGCTAEVCLR